MITPRRAFLSVLAALLIGIAGLPSLAAAQAQVPNPILRPQKAPNPNAKLPVPETTNAAKSATPEAKPATPPVAGDFTHGRVIVLRGLYNFFSRGMDKVAKDLKALGAPVHLSNHSHWQEISDKLIAEYRANPKEVLPVILIGHSLGGDASIVMSNWLAQNGIPVRLVVIFDAVAQTHPIIGGVQEVLNFYKPKGYGQEVNAAPSFTGVINNVDLTERKDIDHLNIDKDPILQAEVIARVIEILNESVGKPARKKSPPPVAKAAPPAKPTTPDTTAATAPAAAGTTPAAGTAPATVGTAPAVAAAPAPVKVPTPVPETTPAVEPLPEPAAAD